MDFDSPTALRARVVALEETVLLLASVMASYPQTRRDLEVRFAELAAHAEAHGASAAGKILYELSPSRWPNCNRFGPDPALRAPQRRRRASDCNKSVAL